MSEKQERIVLAYSGGPLSSVAIPWLRESRHAEVVTVTVDLGQSEPLDGIRVRAIASGAARAHVLDRRDLFARHHLLPAVQAGALDIDSDQAVLTLARPLIAHALVEIAHIEGTRLVAHAAMTKDDREQIDAAVKVLDPEIEVLDVTDTWTLKTDGLNEYARERGIPIVMPNPERAPAEQRSSNNAMLQVTIEFRAGVPVKINGVEMDLVELLTSLETIAASQHVQGSAVLGAAFRARQTRANGGAVTGAETISVGNGACEVVTNV